MEHIQHQGIQIQGLQLCRRQPRVVPELVDQPLHGAHLVHNGLHGLDQHGDIRLGKLGRQLHFKAFGGQLDRRQRVLDFVRKSLRHFTPGLGALGGDDFGNVVEHQQPGVVRQDGAPGNQRGRIVGHAQRRHFQFKGLLPMIQPVLVSLAKEGIELGQYVACKGIKPRYRAERAALEGRHGGAQDSRGARIG